MDYAVLHAGRLAQVHVPAESSSRRKRIDSIVTPPAAQPLLATIRFI